MVMQSVIDSNETAKKQVKSPSGDILDGTLSREADEAAKCAQERALRAGNDDGVGSGDDEV
jgi:hypothetical protein